MFTPEDLEFLARPLQAMITVAPRRGRWPAPRPVWFEVNGDGDLQIFSLTSSPRVARLEKEPRASVVVAAPVGEPEHWIAIEGRVTMTSEGADELADRLAARYWADDDDARLAAIDAWKDSELVRIVLHAEKVQRLSL